ncbi:phosphatidylglycerophosphatase A [Candidatus Purcelliella pentastirinorum]|uniref:Phosphatidylglycerophosphatase A n=1 Tax=Candidatus Purcelliella pentastirinorum TaxID=472834 RepID=A0A346E0A2_9ENTR|nr:phosphatidylglycerophosphatase A [Candidatus Purcelliella pentastirinorum]AXN02407.1 phosphatidylglycerophosphatase A [Candidatus Purcelliella pentastirinorum]WDI78949.1 phosphatidylglycerophosphatase A [Candidatus Purcelliella pentastirinorum]WDR80085.1 phosphatidylglycerophosphatase A [Candidatus Purcelliella pentastirinorum]
MKKINNLAYILAIGGGIGLIPIMPGTLISILTIPLWTMIKFFFKIKIIYLITIVNIIVGIYICKIGEKKIGKKIIKV